MNHTKKLATKLQNSHQVVRFGVVGALNTGIDFGLLFALKALGLPVEVANICSTGVAFALSFMLNKKYTFKASGTNIVREMVLFTVVTLFGLWVLQTIVINLSLPLLQGWLGNQSIALLGAKLLATVVSLVWNYLLYSRVVFKHTKEQPDAHSH